MKAFNRRNTIMAVLAVALVAALVIGGTMALLTDKEEVTNTFTVGDLDITLTEPDYPSPEPRDNRPGDNFPKNPTVTALYGDGFMRTIVEFVDLTTNVTITDPVPLAKIWDTIYYTADYGTATTVLPLDSDGKDVPLALQKSEAALAALVTAGTISKFNGVAFVLDTARSEPGREVYRYIKAASDATPADVFEEGATAVLFNAIVIPSDWDHEDLTLLGSYKIVITAEAIQADNFADQATAFAALDDARGITPPVPVNSEDPADPAEDPAEGDDTGTDTGADTDTGGVAA